MSSIKDVAQLAGVSNGTVSRYFHEPDRVSPDTRERIRNAIDAVGYSPNALASNLRRQQTGLLLVLVWTIGDPYYGAVMSGITRVARREGYRVHVQEVAPGSLENNDLEYLLRSRVADGIIVLGGDAPHESKARRIGVEGHPAIVVCGETGDPGLFSYPRVQIDGFEATRELTRYLAGLGHHRIAFMSGEPGSLMLEERKRGFLAEMESRGLPVNSDWLVDGHLVIDSARRAARRLINARERPTALICANDEMALGAMAELQSNGLVVPDDISVAGFDNTRYADIANPGLTTVAQPAEAIGEQGVYRLLNILRNPAAESGVKHLPHRLILRESTAPPRS